VSIRGEVWHLIGKIESDEPVRQGTVEIVVTDVTSQRTNRDVGNIFFVEHRINVTLRCDFGE
jgi:hypothetical protein